jgi:hypothetical protein
MTVHRVFLTVFVLLGISFAQDTNFPVGPQYLVTNGNPMLLSPIATPSLSLGEGTLAGTSEVPHTVESTSFAPIETVVYLNNVYWGKHPPEEVVARRLDPPVMTPDQTQWYMNFVASQAVPGSAVLNTESVETVATTSVIELAGGPIPASLPASILDTGVTGNADSQALLQRRYGISLGETAAYWKAKKRHAPRVFTNEDLHHK